MGDRGSARDVNEAAQRFAETLADSYRLVYGQASESAERQQRRAKEFSELVSSSLEEQTEAGRTNAQQLSEQAEKQREAYAEFLDSAFSRYRAGTEQATQSAQAGVRTLTDATTGLLGTATGAAGATAGCNGRGRRAGGGGCRVPDRGLRRDERGGDLQTPRGPIGGGAAAGARLRGAQQEARDAARAAGSQDKVILLLGGSPVHG